MPALPEITNDPTGVFNEQVSSTDMSGQILDLLFGPNWDSVSQIVSTGSETTQAASLLLTILGTLSLVALTIGTVIMTYTIFIGVIGTAHEGTPLGKRLSTLWTPIRGAFAVGLMIPTAKGLSVLMVLLLVLIGGSINLANFVFSRGIDYLRENSGQVVVRVPDGEVSNTEKVAGTILASLAAQYHLGMRSGLPFDDSYKIIAPTATDPNYTIQFQPPSVQGVRTEDMGAVVIPCSSPSGDPVCEARKNGIVAMISSLAPVAQAVVANNMTDEEMSENGVSASRAINEGTIRTAVKVYSQSISNVIPQLIQKEGSEFQEGL
ncbi:MAG: DotA/TraY family protein, partial [Desulfomicrobium apsheronum]|nr:DotA/TraY family protein [Desulfomicrobium apsheronum]